MAMVPDRIAVKKYSDNYLKIQASVMTSLSTSDHTYVWNMGDGSTEVTGVTFLEHTYPEDGVYQIALKITGPEVPGDTHILELFQQVVISSHTKTQLSGSIYDLVYNYIPKALNSHIGNNQIDFFIEKYQLHLQPIVNHDIPLEQYNNELYYEALENTLIMQLAAYEVTVISVFNLLQSITNVVSEGGSSSGGNVEDIEQAVKKIVTGPTEVEYYDNPDLYSESDANMVKNMIGAFKPGGMIDNLKENICMLSKRLKIFLPIICPDEYGEKVPRSSRTYNPGKFRGPNNTGLIRGIK